MRYTCYNSRGEAITHNAESLSASSVDMGGAGNASLPSLFITFDARRHLFTRDPTCREFTPGIYTRQPRIEEARTRYLSRKRERGTLYPSTKWSKGVGMGREEEEERRGFRDTCNVRCSVRCSYNISRPRLISFSTDDSRHWTKFTFLFVKYIRGYNSKIKCSWEHFVIIKNFDSFRLTWNENLKHSHFVIIENDIWNTEDSSLTFYEVIKLLLLTKFSDMIYKY